MEFLVEFEISVAQGTPESEVRTRERAEAAAAAKLVDGGHLAPVWKVPDTTAETKVLGLYRADTKQELGGLLRVLSLHQWMNVKVTTLEPHPSDPAAAPPKPMGAGSQL